MPIVDEQIEVSEKILAEDPPNPRIGCPNLPKVLDYGRWLFVTTWESASNESRTATDACA